MATQDSGQDDAKMSAPEIEITRLHLEPFQILLLLHVDFKEDIEKSFDGLSVNINRKTKEVTFKGKTADVQSAQTRMNEFLEKVQSAEIPVSQAQITLLSKPETRKMLLEKLEADCIVAVWQEESGGGQVSLRVHSLSQQDAKRACDVIQTYVVERECDIHAADSELTQSRDLHHFLEKLKVSNEGKLEFTILQTGNKIVVTSTRDIVDKATTEVKAFILEKTRLTITFPFPEDFLKFLKDFCAKELEAIEKDLKEHSVRIVLQQNDVRIRGNRQGINLAFKKLRKLETGVVCTEHTLTDEFEIAFLDTDQCKAELLALEKSKQCVLSVGATTSGKQVKPQSATGSTSVTSSTEEQKPLPVISVSLVKGNIAEQQADMLVNSAPRTRTGGFGFVLKSMLEAGGTALKDEFTSNHPGDLEPGKAFSTAGHQLPCQMVYYMVLPAYKAGEEKVLETMITSCLDEANKAGFKSVAIPALGTGALGYPANVVARTIQGAVSKFGKDVPNTTVRDVRIVLSDKNMKVLTEFQKTLASTTKSESATSSREEQKPSPAISLSIVKGNIAEQNADMLVNSAPRTPTEGFGVVLQSMFDAGGKGLKDEFTSKHPGNLEPGKAFSTAGHQLPCQMVYYVVLPVYKAGEEKVLDSLITSCLTEANKAGFKSVAIPALGTGGLRYPADVVARTIQGAVSKFDKDVPNTTVRDVRIVLSDKNKKVLTDFQKTLQSAIGSDAATSPASPATPASPASPASPATPASPASTASPVISVSIVKGNIAEQQADMLVNSAPKTRTSSFGVVLKSMLDAGGKALKDEFTSKHPGDLEPGKAFSTAGHQLPCQMVYYMVLPVYKAGEEKVLNTMITSCLTEANKAGFKSVAIPALGTGGLRFPADVVARTIQGAVSKFGKDVPNTTVRDVRLVISEKDKNIFKIFEQVHKEVEKTQTTARRNLSTPPSVVDRGRKRSLHICARSQEDVNKVKESILQMLQRHITTYKVEEKNLRSMTQPEKEAIEAICKKYGVGMPPPSSGLMVLKGPSNAVLRAATEIKDMFHEKDRAELHDTMKGLVQWYYLKPQAADVVEHTPAHNFHIEQAFRAKAQTTAIHMRLDGGQAHTVVVDFASMEQYRKSKPSDTYCLIRRPKVEATAPSVLPGTWSPNKEYRVTLAQSSQEYRDVMANFKSTLKGRSATVRKVERIQNERLWKQYTAQKDHLDKQNPGHQNEMALWHGTHPSAMDRIIQHGFNRSYCGLNATAYGKGVYFAVDSKYSADDQYSKPDASGQKHMFQCKVLVGHAVNGASNMIYLPDRLSGIPYDSATNDVTSPEMYIVFSDSQAYPEYLITFVK